MCTTAAKRLNQSWYLLKTRDPVRWMRWDDEIKLFHSKQDKYKKLIIQNPNPHEDGYYGGINEKGVAYISTFVRVAENQISYIRRPYIRLILEASTAKEAVAIIKAFNPRIGGNMFVADENECYGIEGTPEKYFIEKIKSYAVKTNHFLNLPHRNLGFDTNPSFEKWSLAHQKRAEELIPQAENLKDLKNILKDRKNAEQKVAICTTAKEDNCFTYSAFIFNTQKVKVYYCQGNPLEKPFKEFDFKANLPKEEKLPNYKD
jgi:predicted choloylglycine hydrolase